MLNNLRKRRIDPALRLALPLLAPLLLALSLSDPGSAAAPDAVARSEIHHLLDYIERSGCDFNRNARWYPAKDGRAHIEKKYAYLLDKGWVSTAEEFIARAATQSSMSGTPYQVRCAGARAEPSAQWLREELLRYRGAR